MCSEQTEVFTFNIRFTAYECHRIHCNFGNHLSFFFISAQEANAFHSCVASHIQGCNLLQLQIFDSQLWLGRQRMPSCNAYNLPSSLYPLSIVTEAEGLNQCKEVFLQNITSALETSTNSRQKICVSIQMMYECLMYGQAEESRQFLTSMYGTSFLLTSSLTGQICTEVYQGKVPMEEDSSKIVDEIG